MDQGSATPDVLDRNMLDEAAGGDLELIQELAELYVMDAESQMGGLETAVASANLEEIGRIAHGLKGSSASIGATEAAHAFKRLEEMGRSGDAVGLDSALEHALAAFERVRVVLAGL